MKHRVVELGLGNRKTTRIGYVLLLALFLSFSVWQARAKEPALTAIMLYDTPDGVSYLQVTGVLINGKLEMRHCSQCSAAPLDKSSYGKLQKFFLAPGMTLSRGEDGVLRVSSGDEAAEPVAPANLKFEGGHALTAQQLADQAVLKATSLGGPDGNAAAVPVLGKKVTLIFVSAPNTELAEYLRAKRAADIPGWKAYLGKYGTSSHATDARAALSALHVEAGRMSLSQYVKGVSAGAPAYEVLRAAKVSSDSAKLAYRETPDQAQLEAAVNAELAKIVEREHSELVQYHDALAKRTSGYGHLVSAQKDNDIVAGIDATFAPFATVRAELTSYTMSLENALRTADKYREAKQFDQAYTAIDPFRSFADEETRLGAVVDAAYSFHLAKGKDAAGAADWSTAVREFDRAVGVKNTPEATDLLKKGRAELTTSLDKAAAAKALAESKEFEQQNDALNAYEVLSHLPDGPQKYVEDDLERLEPAYIAACSKAAKDLRTHHESIGGLADEQAIQKAYEYLEEAYDLSDDDSYHDRAVLLGNELSAYFLEQSKRYLKKPNGSGSEMGWTYLTRALPYKASNLASVREAMDSASAIHAVRSRMSIQVQFRDANSQRQSAGFSRQLENAIITSLESSGLPVKVVRVDESTPVPPDFEITGDVIQHHLSVVPVVESVASKYRGTEREVTTEGYSRLVRATQTAEMELQALLLAPTAKGKTEAKIQASEIASAKQKVADAQAAADSYKEKTRTEVTVRPYNYEKKTVSVSGVVELQFRISDSLSGQNSEIVPVSAEDHMQYVTLDKVNPEDTEGVKVSGTVPDQEEFMLRLEQVAVSKLLAQVRQRVELLPQKIYRGAVGKEKDSDIEGAGESYLRYLAIARDGDSESRRHAAAFLFENFNIERAPSSAP